MVIETFFDSRVKHWDLFHGIGSSLLFGPGSLFQLNLSYLCLQSFLLSEEPIKERDYLDVIPPLLSLRPQLRNAFSIF